MGLKNFSLPETVNLNKILISIENYIGKVKKEDFIIHIHIDEKKITLSAIKLLYLLLNNYEDNYFIIIKNLPYCLMPDALEHIVYEKISKNKYHYDGICEKCYLKNICPGWNESLNIERNKVNLPKDIPKEIVMEITTKCNLNCRCCNLDKSNPINVEFKIVKNIIDECKTLGIRAVRFTGGEPLLNPDLEKMLSYAKRNGFYVLLNTNATLLNSHLLKILEKNVDNVLISLQGYNQTSERRLTNSHVDFNKKLTNIIKLNLRIPIVRIGSVISKTLIENFNRYYYLLKKIGINHWELYRPILKDDEEFEISKKDLIKIMYLLIEIKKTGMKTKIANPLPFCIVKNKKISLMSLLGGIADDGHSRIVWDARGYFKPSYFINVYLGKTIEESWQAPFLKKLRSLDYLPQKCKECYYLKWCKGGSRALAKIFNKNYFSPDPLFKT